MAGRGQRVSPGMQSILQRVGIRQLPGICSIPTSARIFGFVNQGGTVDMFYSSLTEI